MTLSIGLRPPPTPAPAVERGEQAVNAAVDMARRNPDWEGESPAADQKRALDRATKERALLDGAEILWADDIPSNKRNETRMQASER